MLAFRTATDADLPRLAAMNHRLIQDEGHRNPMDEAQLGQRMRGWLESGGYEAVLVEEAGAIVGYALFRRQPGHVYLRHFYVERAYRRQGIGRATIGWLREHRWNGAGEVRLDVLVHNRAGAAFWRSVGFRDYCVTMTLGTSGAFTETSP